MNSFGNYYGTQGYTPSNDLYQSQADVYGNEFANPMNPANMNPGFGMDPNLLTPSYTAGYRPQYNGPQPYNQYGRVGFFSGINSILNPFSEDSRFGNPIDNQREAVEGVASRPFDSVVWAGQRVAAPMAAFGLAFKYGMKPGMAMGNAVGRAFGRGIASGMGRFMPGIVGRGLAGALGGGTIMGAAVPGVLGIAGSVMLPMAIGQAAMWGVQKGLVDPYINTRKEARDLRDNFAGVTFGDARGNVVTGQGLSYRESTSIARNITEQGIHDMTFSSGEYANIADYSARAGLLDDVNSKQIAKRVKDVAAQVKLIMAIAGDPSIKNAIEELAKLRNAGASVTGGNSSQAAQALTQLGMSAAVAGRSVQNIMATVGAQGQYLYQANGMTPYLGQMAAANILGSFESARRSGLLSTGQIARMGGTEGATQASLTGQINTLQTPIAKIMMYNQYMTGHEGANKSLIGAVSQFGQDAAGNPLGTMGRMEIFSRMMAGKKLDEKGSMAVEDIVAKILDSTSTPRNKDGKYDATQMYPVLKDMMGWTDDQAAAYLAQRTAETDPDTYKQGVKARNAQTQKQVREYISQNSLYSGVIGRNYRALRQYGQDLTSGIASVAEAFTGAQAAAGDASQGFFDKVVYGTTLNNENKGLSADFRIDAATLNHASTPVPSKMLKSMDFMTSITGNGVLGKDGHMGSNKYNKIVNTINALAKDQNPDAIAFINASNKEDKGKALDKLLKTPEMKEVAPIINEGYKNYDDFIGSTLKIGTENPNTEAPKQETGLLDKYVVNPIRGLLGKAPVGQAPEDDHSLTGKVTNSLRVDKTTPDMGLADSFEAIGQIHNLADKINDGASQGDIDKILNDKDNHNYDLVKKLLGNRRGSEAKQYITDAFNKSVEEGTAQAGYVSFNIGLGIEDLKKNPERIGDAKDRAKFVAAMKSKTPESEEIMQNIAAKNLRNYNGGELVSTGLAGASELKLDESHGFESQQDALGIANAKAYAAKASGMFDFKQVQDMQNALDEQKNNKDFADAVKTLKEGAQALKDGTSSSDSTSMSGTFWRSLNPFASPVVGSQKNPRDGGSPQGSK